MIGIASYLVSSPRRVLLLLIVSAAAVIATQFAPAFSGSSVAPGASAERVNVADSISSHVYSNLLATPREVPQDTARMSARQNVTSSSEPEAPGFAAPSDSGSNLDEEEFVAEIVVSVPQADNPGEVEEQLVLRPTFSWVNVFSDGSTVDGEPVQVGDVITAFDPQGTLVGRFTVVSEGRFGLMALYEDDPTTSVDEGAIPGDEITFEINGLPAVVVGPQAPVWTSNGAILLSNLAAVS